MFAAHFIYMLHPKELSIVDFDYDLPNERIAKYPLAERDSSKLLIYNNGIMNESRYAHLPEHLRSNSLLVFNNTKVVEARLMFQKATGGAIELFCLEPSDIYGDITQAMMQKGSVQWKCLIGGAKKWKQGALTKSMIYKGNTYIIKAEKVLQLADCYLITFSWDNDTISFAEMLHFAGEIPLPPYLNREAEEADKTTYQTVYAKFDGSVAAPTAGLHFTESLLQNLSAKNIEQLFVTLHVGAGTFKPVKAKKMEDHEMHEEFIDVSLNAIQQLMHQTDDIIAVGTTSLRTIESLYWMGVKLLGMNHKPIEEIEVKEISVQQWDPYELATSYSKTEALNALAEWMRKTNLERIITKTQIIIAPGYSLKVANAIITNFHQPQSTLLLLISAIVGDDWKKIYAYAMQNDFRFLSYGDGSLLWQRTSN